MDTHNKRSHFLTNLTISIELPNAFKHDAINCTHQTTWSSNQWNFHHLVIFSKKAKDKCFLSFVNAKFWIGFQKTHQILYYVLLASQQYRMVFKYFYCYKKYCQIWLNHQMDHCPFEYIMKLKKKKTLHPTTLQQSQHPTIHCPIEVQMMNPSILCKPSHTRIQL
jgi:hypothetical protein